jgi:cytochrome c-type biogenesis protein CcmH
MRARALAPWVALVAVLVVSLVVLVGRSQPSNSPVARANRLDHEFKCPDCEGESVANSQTASAIAIRDGVKARIAQGQSDAQIRAYYESVYPGISLKPGSNGINVLIWLIPVVALGAGFAAIVVMLQRARRQPRLAASEEDERLVARARTAEAAE